MKKTQNFKLSPLSCAIISVLASNHALAGTNFSISPLSVPHTIFPGSTAVALYTVTNNTHTTRYGYSIQGLPLDVQQIIAAGNCPALINLAPQASCVLQLNITGPVQSNFAICKGTSCTSADEPLSLAINTGALPIVAAGEDRTNRHALIAQSSDSGQTWNYSSDYPMAGFSPAVRTAPSQFAEFVDASCSGNICVVAGEDIIREQALIGQSNDGGLTWNYLLPDNSSSILYSVSCSGPNCVAVGEDFNPDLPLILQSTNGGVTWNKVPSTSDTGILNSVSCSGNNCVAGGEDLESAFPLIAQSTDGGVTWNYQSTYTATEGEINSVSCIGQTCVAVGDFEVSNAPPSQPLTAYSIDGGQHWIYNADGTLNSGTLESVSCSVSGIQSVCVAGGVDRTNSPSVGYIAYSTNGGQSWTYSDLAGFAEINSVSCSGLFCVAAGFTADSPTLPALSQSFDGGVTWNPVATSTSQGALIGVSCNGAVCAAVGNYQSPELAFIASTMNTGISWITPSIFTDTSILTGVSVSSVNP